MRMSLSEFWCKNYQQDTPFKKSLGYLTVSQTPQLKILIMKESLKQLFAFLTPTNCL